PRRPPLLVLTTPTRPPTPAPPSPPQPSVGQPTAPKAACDKTPARTPEIATARLARGGCGAEASGSALTTDAPELITPSPTQPGMGQSTNQRTYSAHPNAPHPQQRVTKRPQARPRSPQRGSPGKVWDS